MVNSQTNRLSKKKHLEAVVLEETQSLDRCFHPVPAADLLQDGVIGVLHSNLLQGKPYQ